MRDPYITPQDVKSVLNTTMSDTALNSLCVYVSDAFDMLMWRFDEWRLWYEEVDVSFRVRRWKSIYLIRATPIKEIKKQTIIRDTTWREEDYTWRIVSTNSYVKFVNRVYADWLMKLKVVRWFFDKTEVPAHLKTTLINIVAEMAKERYDAESKINWESVWDETSFKVWNFSVNYSQERTNKDNAANNVSRFLWIGGANDLSLLYNKYGRDGIWFIN